jgi:hypothetical protein
MMTDGDVSARDDIAESAASVDGHLAGRAAMQQLLDAQCAVPRRSSVARFFGFSPLSRETHALYRSVVGEIEVGESLDRLGPEWSVLHSLPVDGDSSDIDHLVVGPAGVFIIATRTHAGMNVWASQRTFMVAGVRYPHIRSMEYEMGRAERMLSAAAGSPVQVAGILAIVAPKSLVVREKHRDVAVLAAPNVVAWLHRSKRVLSPAEVSHISTAASLASTWSSTPESADPQSIGARFEQLRSEVRTAWRTQLAWAISLSAVGVGGFGGLTYAILLNAISTASY